MSVVRLCPYDVNGENCKYETHYGEPNFSKCKNCDRTNNICKTSKTILKGDKRKMTKEALKEEAIKYAVDYPTSYGKGYKHKDLRIAYLAGAEPREKRIKDLEKENERLTVSYETLKLHDEEEIGMLKSENAELKKKCYKKAVKDYCKLEKENAELKKKNKWYSEQVCNKECAEVWGNLDKAKEIMNIAIEGIKYWGIVGGNERPLEKQAEMLFNLFLDKAEQFLNSEVEK